MNLGWQGPKLYEFGLQGLCKKNRGDGVAEGNLWGMNSMGSNLLQLTGI